MRLIPLLVFTGLTSFIYGQLDRFSLMGLPVAQDVSELTSIVTPAKGSIAFSDADNSIYVYDETNTRWVKVLDNSPVITNEVLVEDDDYIYVSVFINSTDWMVTRYHKNDINAETTAMGSGVQPTTLVVIAALTYN